MDHSFTCKLHPYLPLPHKHSPNSTTNDRSGRHLIAVYYSFINPKKYEKLSRPSWLIRSRQFTHISGHPSAVGRSQDRESSPAKDWHCATQPTVTTWLDKQKQPTFENQSLSHTVYTVHTWMNA